MHRDLEIHVRIRGRVVPLEGVEAFRRWLIWDKEKPNPAIPAFVDLAQQYMLNKE